MIRSPVRVAAAGAALASALAIVCAQVAPAARAKDTPFPPIAARKTQCPKVVYTLDKNFTVHVVIAAEKGHHPDVSLLTCQTAYAVALAGKKDYGRIPLEATGKKIVVAGATYAQAVGGPDVWPATSGPVYGWFGNGIEVLLMIPSGP